MAEVALPAFAELGFSGPHSLLTRGDCARLLHATRKENKTQPLDWHKGHAAASPAFHEIATHPGILGIVRDLIGKNVVLWGASLISRGPGVVHPWHSDIETSFAVPGKTVSVWVGVEHTTAESSLMLIPYSHRFGATIQQIRQEHGLRRDEATTDRVVGWAQQRDTRSALLKPAMSDGDAIFFDGLLWHASHNVSQTTRQALVLQYATPDTAIHIPDLKVLDWPFRRIEEPRPPCLLVSGADTAGANRIVPPPTASGGPVPLTSRVEPLPLPLQPADGQAWSMYPMFKGSTPVVRSWGCHASVLMPGHTPHPPHTHKEEELLMVLDGEVELDLPALGPPSPRLTRGQFVYYPAHFPHTLRAVSETPANYLMFKWYNGASEAGTPIGFGRFEAPRDDAGGTGGSSRQRIFAGPTTNLRKLHAHVSTLFPHDGYEPHVDPYDVAIVVLDGEVETLGQRTPRNTVIFYAAGEAHGMTNPGGTPARYVVFEFHGAAGREDRAHPPLMARLADPARWKRKIKRVLHLSA